MTSTIAQRAVPEAGAPKRVQRSLPLRVQLWLPMVDVAAVRAALGVNEDEVLDLIEDGQLAWAWDISTEAAEKAEVRILARCVREYQMFGDKDRLAGGNPRDITFEEVVQIVFPGHQTRPWVWGRELARAFNCSSDHVLNLIRGGSLCLLPGHVVPKAVPRSTPNHQPATIGWRRGPGGSPCVALESVLRFLKERRKGGIT